MRGPKPLYGVELDEEQRQLCEQLARNGRSEQRIVLRARIALLADDEWSNEHIARELGCSAVVVRKWRKRWVREGFSLEDAPRSGRPPLFSPRAKGSGHGDRL